jgi:hypothetical protein
MIIRVEWAVAVVIATSVAAEAAPPAFLPPARSSAATPMIDIPAKAGDFLAFCQSNDEICTGFIGDVGQALSSEEQGAKKSGYCAHKGAAPNEMSERVRKWILYRPQTHGLATNRTIADALIAIYPCKAARAPDKSEKKAK